ncbi:MAG TPA: glycosyltransferase family 39 protein [Anaerolineae bacterium]|nr:glycosyltransferase family 39 protein [Anaerolineae bacterium]HQI86233.1 glycosyltransferase family 39 protein [Anaerolineae bacterium]
MVTTDLPVRADTDHPQETGSRAKLVEHWSRYAQAIAPWLIALAFVAVEIRRVWGQIAVRYPDFFGWAERASRLDFTNLAHPDWVHGLYPLGYPLLLRLGRELGVDVLRTAFALSIFGGFLGLLGAYWLVRRMTGRWWLALLTELLQACMAFYLFFGNLDATDMLASGLILCAFPLLLSEKRQRAAAFGAGLLVGLSYLIRYTASLTVAACALFLLLPFIMRRDRESLWSLAFFLLGAFIGAFPQFLCSLLVKRNPLYNEQAHNLWFHLRDSSDYIYDWHEVPMDIGMLEVILGQPKAFFSHWWEMFLSYWLTGDGYSVDGLLGMLAQAGFWFALLFTRGDLKPKARALFGIYSVGLIALLSMVRLDRRFLITLMPLQVFGSLYFAWSLLPEKTTVRRRQIPLRLPLLLLLCVPYLRQPVSFMLSNHGDEALVEVSNMLHAAGMQAAGEVFSTNVDYHDVASPWKWRYAMAFALARDLKTQEEILGYIHEHGYRFFIMDKATGLFLYPTQEGLLNPENRFSGLTPIYVPNEREAVVYRVEGPQWAAPTPISATLQNGIALTGYELYQSADQPPGSGQRVGLYLHWRTSAPVAQFLKVFVHVLGADGQLVTQHDSVPALWTYPVDRWAVGETVVDFHPLLFGPDAGSGPFTILVGFYDGNSGARIPVQAAERMSNDAIVVTQVMLE